MSEKSLALTEHALRIGLAILALALAATLASKPDAGLNRLNAGPKPGVVMEW